MNRLQVTAPLVHMRKEPSDAAELVNQALFGETVEAAPASGGWSEVCTADGYTGFCETKFLDGRDATSPDAGTGSAAFVTARESRLLSGGSDEPVMRLSYGSRIALAPDYADGSDPVVTLPEYGRESSRRIPVADVVLPGAMAPAGATPDAILAEAVKFLGVPYLWGGRSAWGVDCSGLVQLVFARFGIAIARDSRDQFLAGEAVSGDPAAGDLLFFGRERVTHVGFARGDGTFLHASGWVRVNSLDPASPVAR
ncbi:MAG: C40 family peptidase, partial [Gemmatimonadetes bacterium]|nr:C40 family peptidase [Gemmatimonadota bacterium]